MTKLKKKKKRMLSRSCKAKGRVAANQVKALIHKTFPMLGEDDVIRTSGGQIGEDIVLSPKGRQILPVSIEVKNVEQLNIWKALKQCEDNAGAHVPVLMFRRNKSKLYAAIEADKLLGMYQIIHILTRREEADDGSVV